MNKRNRLITLFSLLVLVSMLLSACGVSAIEEPSEIQVLNASVPVDLCEGISYCTKVLVSETVNGDVFATIYGKQSVYEISFAEQSIIAPFTPFPLTAQDISKTPEISGCKLVDWDITDNETDVIDIYYIFSCG